MKVLLFGATGMVGQGVLRECLLDPDVERVLSIGRTKLGTEHAKLEERIVEDVADVSPIASDLRGFDACFFCLGVSSAGMREADYRRITKDLTLSVARTLVETSPQMTFVYVSGAGTNGSEQGGSMWSRVKGETENALMQMPFDAAYMFRPAFIQPLHGIKSKTKLYRAAYAMTSPFYGMWKAIAPKWVSTTENVGKAMLRVAKKKTKEKRVVENDEINRIANATPSSA